MIGLFSMYEPGATFTTLSVVPADTIESIAALIVSFGSVNVPALESSPSLATYTIPFSATPVAVAVGSENWNFLALWSYFKNLPS